MITPRIKAWLRTMLLPLLMLVHLVFGCAVSKTANPEDYFLKYGPNPLTFDMLVQRIPVTHLSSADSLDLQSLSHQLKSTPVSRERVQIIFIGHDIILLLTARDTLELIKQGWWDGTLYTDVHSNNNQLYYVNRTTSKHTKYGSFSFFFIPIKEYKANKAQGLYAINIAPYSRLFHTQ